MDTSRLQNNSKQKKKRKHQAPLHIVGSSDPLSFNAQPAETEFIKPVFKDKDDPANYLGYGIVSYLSLIKVLIATFSLLSLVHLPVIITYGRYENYSNDIMDNYQKVYSLGNMGFSGPRCVHVGLRVDNALLSCPTGSIRQLIDFGFISTDEDQNVCLRTLTDYECEHAYNRQSALAAIESQCLNRSSCLISNISSMLHRNATGGLCSQAETKFFVQYACEHSQEELEARRRDGAKAACVAVFSALAIFAMIFYQRKSTQLEQIEWDVSTVTASDYTVDMTLTEGMLENFVKEANPGIDESAGYRLKQYLQQTLEEKLTNEVPSLGFQRISRVKVADI